MASPDVYIAVIGAGGVGQAFLAQLATLRGTYPGLKVALIARSAVCLQAAADFSSVVSLDSWSADLAAASTPTPSPEKLLAYLTSAPSPHRVLVDNTATDVWGAAYPAFLAAGVHVVTPNKRAFSGEAGLWDAIQAASHQPGGGQVLHEATVGAGLPVLTTLADLLATGDTVTRIEGVFSGTLSFLLNGFSLATSDEKWSAAVSNAQKLGYTEPDPRDDLSGMDVARKLTILARRCGVRVAGPAAFPVQSLVPDALAEVTDVPAFLDQLPAFDGEMADRRAAAERDGAVLRYVGSIDLVTQTLTVGLAHTPTSSAIAGLRGSDNLIAFHTARYAAAPLVVQGAGAGAAVTAMGVSADLLRVVQRLG